MSRLDTETKRKLREMGVPALVDAFDLQDDALTMGLVLEERIKLAVDDAHAAFPHSKVEGLVRRAGLRYPNADLRRVDPPTDDVRSMLLELLERRYDATSTVFCTQYAKKDWHQRLGGGVHADAIMDRIVQNTHWIETGDVKPTLSAANRSAGRSVTQVSILSLEGH